MTDGRDEAADGDSSSSDDDTRTASEVPSPRARPVLWYLRSRNGLIVTSRDVLSSVLLVAVVGLALVAVSGVSPPMVAVESGSMQPHLEQGDLVVVVEGDRFAPELADEHGVVTHERATGTGHDRWERPGSVIVYRPHTVENEPRPGPPIIHRAVLHVEPGENWVAQLEPQYLAGVSECSDVPELCPAPHEGYVTRGDYNGDYDQVSNPARISTIVKPEWVQGRAVAHVPFLGCIRLALSGTPGCLAEDSRTSP